MANYRSGKREKNIKKRVLLVSENKTQLSSKNKIPSSQIFSENKVIYSRLGVFNINIMFGRFVIAMSCYGARRTNQDFVELYLVDASRNTYGFRGTSSITGSIRGRWVAFKIVDVLYDEVGGWAITVGGCVEAHTRVCLVVRVWVEGGGVSATAWTW